MTFLSPPLWNVALCAEALVSKNVEVLLLVVIVLSGYLALIIKKTVIWFLNFYFG